VLDALLHADRVIPISEAALDDIDAYFGPAAAGVRDHSTVVHEGVAELSFTVRGDVSEPWTPEQGELIARGGYVLVIGNIFSHKQLPEALEALAGSPFPVIGFGDLGGRPVPAGVHFISGGLLSDAHIDELYRQADLVVFPSAYEGFGLPTAESGQRGKHVVLFDTEVGREVVEQLGMADLAVFFRHFDELAEVVAATRETARSHPSAERRLRPIEAYNEGILEVLLEVLEQPVDLDRFRARVESFRRVEQYANAVEHRLGDALGQVAAIQRSPAYRLTQFWVRPLRPIVGAIRRTR
jgi:glycosyltransferase involved in cell wall biosynthesis